MAATLKNIEGEDAAIHALRVPGPIMVGRGRDCTIRLHDKRVSRHHCLLSFRTGKWYVKDLGSTNGIEVNDQKVRRAELKHGDTLTIGRIRLQVVLDGADEVRDESGRALPRPACPPAGQREIEEPDAQAEGLDDVGTQDIELLAERDSDKPPPKNLFAGRYELGRLIHHGSTGDFFCVKDTKGGQMVCLKFLAQSVVADEAEMKRFVRGVRTAAKLQHPNIVQLLRAGMADHRWFVVMEFVDGPSLREVIKKYGIGNMLSSGKVLGIARDIAGALEVAYERQVLHRNIRPDNILLTKSGSAKLCDFTLVRGVVLTTLQRISESSELVGDLAYMPPERIEPHGGADCRSDLYALGACLYTLLAGRRPFSGRGTVDLIERIRHDEPVPPSKFNLSVPGPLESLVLKCLAKNPEDRFRSPMEFREELSRVARFQGLWR